MEENDIYLEIADFSREAGFIRYPVYQSNYYKEYSEEITPFTTYYLEALRLNILYSNENIAKQLDSFTDFCEKAFLICNMSNQKSINTIIRNYSNKIRNMLVHNSNIVHGISIDEDFNLGNISDNDDFYETYNNIIKYYENWAIQNKILVDEFENKRGCCVAIAMPLIKDLCDSNNCYLALSGVKKDYAGKLLSGACHVKSDIKLAYNSINNFLMYIYGFRFTECHFIDETRRYTYYDNRKRFNRLTTNGKPLRNPIKFSSDYRLHSKNRNFYSHYSCCEKKILAHMGFVNLDCSKLILGQKVINKLSSYEFRLKYHPCRMCRPALVGCYYIGCDFLSYYDYVFYTMSPSHTIKLSTGIDPKEPLIVY